MSEIDPTIGRKLYMFYSASSPLPPGMVVQDRTKPLDANIVWVNSSTNVNLAGFDHIGNPFRQTSVSLTPAGAHGNGNSVWCEWMPYQVGQAKATNKPLQELHPPTVPPKSATPGQ